MKTLFYVAGTAAVLIAAASAFQKAPNPLPPPYQTPSASNPSRVISQPGGMQLRLPPGFKIEQYASGFVRPRYMTMGPSGETLLSDSADTGKVYILLDKNKDFKAETKKVLIRNLKRPFGMAFWKEYLYVAEKTSIKRYKYNRAAMTVGAGQQVVNLSKFSQGHWTRTVVFDPAGQKMYVAIGSASNVNAGEPAMRAAISRFNPDGSGQEIFGSGTRNPVGLAWEPFTGTLWAAVQERDALGDNLVPDYFTSIKQGGFYGWPYAYTGPNEDPRRKGEKPGLVKTTLVPDVPFQAHLAVLDARFYTGTQFPPEYRGGAFIACHGSWNRAQRVGYSLIFVPFQNGKATGEVREFLTGFMLDPSIKDVWGRPVGLLQLPDGSLLMSDDGGKKIWRISYTG